MASMSSSHHRAFDKGWNMDQNYQRALFFLDLSVQQIRLVDPESANRLDRFYVQKIKSEFQGLFARDDVRALVSDAASIGPTLKLAGDQMLKSVFHNNSAPPGLAPSYLQSGHVPSKGLLPANAGTFFPENLLAGFQTDRHPMTAANAPPSAGSSNATSANWYKDYSADEAVLRARAENMASHHSHDGYSGSSNNTSLDYNHLAASQPPASENRAPTHSASNPTASQGQHGTIGNGRLSKSYSWQDALARLMPVASPTATVQRRAAPHSGSQYSPESDAGGIHLGAEALQAADPSANSPQLSSSHQGPKTPRKVRQVTTQGGNVESVRSLTATAPPTATESVSTRPPGSAVTPAATLAATPAAVKTEPAKRQLTDDDFVAYLESRGFSVSKSTNGAAGASAQPAAPATPEAVAAAPSNKNWAKVAALPGAGIVSADAQFGSLKPPTPSRTILGKNDDSEEALSDLEPASSIPSEPGRETYAQTLRVVWIYDLPPAYTLAQVSAKVAEGPLLSIELNQNIAEHIPGLSACVVFQHAADATRFLESNGCAIELGARIDASKPDHWQSGDMVVDNRPTPKTCQSVPNVNRFHCSKDAPNASLNLGGSYPFHASSFLMAMETHRARRRLKFARKGLFQAVPLGTFKRDVLTLAGGTAHIEFFHFFNAGECTVVFDSVATAICVHSAFDAWRQGRRTPADIVDMLAHRSSPTTVAQHVVQPGAGGGRRGVGGIGKGGKGGANGADKLASVLASGTTRKETKQAFPRGKYEGMDVGYCKDFNEDPCTMLVSTYVNPGTMGNVVSGIRGVFQGPRVPVDTL